MSEKKKSKEERLESLIKLSKEIEKSIAKNTKPSPLPKPKGK